MVAEDEYMKASGENAYQAQGHAGLQKPDTQPGHVRGVLHTPVGAEHGRIAPASNTVVEYVEHFWWARWCLDEPRSTEVLTYPSVHVTFEAGEERIVGVVRAKFVRRLAGEDWVFGIKFRPGMFRPLSRAPVHRLTDRVVPLNDALGGSELGDVVRAQKSMDERARIVERALGRELPPPPPKALLARDLVERVRADSDLRTVAVLSQVSGLTERTLQRLFREFVGVSPKWVVSRFRLQEAAELLATTSETIASVAARLGYFDQAHFARDFKGVVGLPPIEFLAKNRAR